MEQPLWTLFVRTGAPEIYLQYKQECRTQTPRPEDRTSCPRA